MSGTWMLDTPSAWNTGQTDDPGYRENQNVGQKNHVHLACSTGILPVTLYVFVWNVIDGNLAII